MWGVCGGEGGAKLSSLNQKCLLCWGVGDVKGGPFTVPDLIIVSRLGITYGQEGGLWNQAGSCSSMGVFFFSIFGDRGGVDLLC